VHQKDIIKNMSASRILGEEMKELNDLADKSLATQILDHEAYRLKIQQIFQRVKDATMSFFVDTIMFIIYIYILIDCFQFEMAISIQQTASEIRDDTKVSV
jgi:hypothetical protein